MRSLGKGGKYNSEGVWCWSSEHEESILITRSIRETQKNQAKPNSLFTKMFYCFKFDPSRYYVMEDYGGVNQVVLQEGQAELGGAHPQVLYPANCTVLPMYSNTAANQPTTYYENLQNIVSPPASLPFRGLTAFSGGGLLHQSPIMVPVDQLNINWQYQIPNVREDSHLHNPDQTVLYYGTSEFQDLPSQSELGIICETTTPFPNTEKVSTQAREGCCEKPATIRKPTRSTNMSTLNETLNIMDIAPERKKTRPINPAYAIRKSRITNSVYKRPFRDRVIHLLALKDYTKSDLLKQLQKDGIPEEDKNTLGRILQEVAILNSNFLYRLKDYFFRHIHKDWPGYDQRERQSLELILANKVKQMEKLNSASQAKDTCPEETVSEDRASNPAVIDPLRKRKVRVSHLTTTGLFTPKIQGNNGQKPALGGPLTFAKTENSAQPAPLTNHHPSLKPVPVQSSSYSLSTRTGMKAQSETLRRQNSQMSVEKFTPPCPQKKYSKGLKNACLRMQSTLRSRFLKYQAGNQRCRNENVKKKNVEEAKDQSKEAELKASKDMEILASAPASASEQPAYLMKYVTIVTPEQRWHFEQDFNAEFNEHQSLYTKMIRLSRIFIQLDAKRKELPPDSKEYQDINETIKGEYQKMLQLNPNFKEEKCRCLYLYDKLSHIKQLINDYDQQQQVKKTQSTLVSPE